MWRVEGSTVGGTAAERWLSRTGSIDHFQDSVLAAGWMAAPFFEVGSTEEEWDLGGRQLPRRYLSLAGVEERGLG